MAGPRGIEPQDRGAHEREGHPEQDRLRRQHRRGEHPLRRAERAHLLARGRQQRRVAPVGDRDERHVENEREKPDGAFDPGIGAQRIANALGKARAERCAGGKPPDEDHEDERLRVGGVPEEEFYVVRPDGLVDETTETRGKERNEQQVDSLLHPLVIPRVGAKGCAARRRSCDRSAQSGPDRPRV